MMNLTIHFQFDIADSATSAGYMRNGVISFASPVQVEAGCVKDVRVKKCGNAGKPPNRLHNLCTGLFIGFLCMKNNAL
jgi:hypothetical protein